MSKHAKINVIGRKITSILKIAVDKVILALPVCHLCDFSPITLLKGKIIEFNCERKLLLIVFIPSCPCTHPEEESSRLRLLHQLRFHNGYNS